MKLIIFVFSLAILLSVGLIYFIENRNPNTDDEEDVRPVEEEININVQDVYYLRWIDEIEIEKTRDIDSLLAQKIEIDNCPGCELVLIKDGERASVSSCNEFFSHKEDGFYAESNNEIERERFFIRKCYPLKYINNAKDATISYRHMKSVEDASTELCFLLHNKFENKGVEINCSAMSIDKELSTAIEIVLVEEREVASQFTIKALAWGDFDGDDTEDTLIHANYIPPNRSDSGFSEVFILKINEKGEVSIK